MGLLIKLYRRIFNPKPSDGFDYFIDRQNRKIWFGWSGNPVKDLILIHKGLIIGRMLISWNDNYIELCDIVIYEKHVQYRNSGIGSWMFSQLKDVAKKHNIGRIEGAMQPENVIVRPKLIKFYQDQGCEIQGNWFNCWVEKD